MRPAVPAPRRSRSRTFLRRLGRCFLGALLLGMTGWAALAVYFANLSAGASPRTVRACVLVIVLLTCILFLRPRRYGVASFALIFLMVLVWFISLRPSNVRNWTPDAALLASAEVRGDELVVRNVRNFQYRSESDFTQNWEERKFDLNKLNSVDFFLCYWGSKAIAHGIASFGFDDGRFLAISIEARKEKAETYSAVGAFFRQYELIYVFADERDVIRLRTNYRREQVYLYRTRTDRTQARAILLSYVERANWLQDHPEFYNALTNNCITSVVPHGRAGNPAAHMSWQIVLSGYAARHAYRNGHLDDSIPFEQLEGRSHINDEAVAADQDPDFPARIRAALPQPSQHTNADRM